MWLQLLHLTFALQELYVTALFSIMYLLHSGYCDFYNIATFNCKKLGCFCLIYWQLTAHSLATKLVTFSFLPWAHAVDSLAVSEKARWYSVAI